MDRLCLFDVDGTLVHVAEEVAFFQAFRELCGREIDLGWIEGLTVSDATFVEAMLARAGLPSGRLDVARALDRFVTVLEAGIDSGELPVRRVAGAVEFVTALADDCAVALATGCVEPSARAKLRPLGLDAVFACGGFSSTEKTRAEILERAVAAAARHYGREFERSGIVYFGDGPWDITAAREVGIQFIGINERERGRARLRQAGAEAVFADYSDPAAVRQALRR